MSLTFQWLLMVTPGGFARRERELIFYLIEENRLSSARIHDGRSTDSCGDSLETILVMKAAENCVDENAMAP